MDLVPQVQKRLWITKSSYCIFDRWLQVIILIKYDWSKEDIRPHERL